MPRQTMAATEVCWHHDVYRYFNNDAKVHTPFDAQALATRLGLG